MSRSIRGTRPVRIQGGAGQRASGGKEGPAFFWEAPADWGQGWGDRLEVPRRNRALGWGRKCWEKQEKVPGGEGEAADLGEQEVCRPRLGRPHSALGRPVACWKGQNVTGGLRCQWKGQYCGHRNRGGERPSAFPHLSLHFFLHRSFRHLSIHPSFCVSP